MCRSCWGRLGHSRHIIISGVDFRITWPAWSLPPTQRNCWADNEYFPYKKGKNKQNSFGRRFPWRRIMHTRRTSPESCFGGDRREGGKLVSDSLTVSVTETLRRRVNSCIITSLEPLREEVLVVPVLYVGREKKEEGTVYYQILSLYFSLPKRFPPLFDVSSHQIPGESFSYFLTDSFCQPSISLLVCAGRYIAENQKVSAVSGNYQAIGRAQHTH